MNHELHDEMYIGHRNEDNGVCFIELLGETQPNGPLKRTIPCYYHQFTSLA